MCGFGRMKTWEKMNEPEYLNLWLAEIVQFLSIWRCTLGTFNHLAKRQVSTLYAKCNRTRSSCEDPNGGLYFNCRQGWQFAINFLLNTEFLQNPIWHCLELPGGKNLVRRCHWRSANWTRCLPPYIISFASLAPTCTNYTPLFSQSKTKQ